MTDLVRVHQTPDGNCGLYSVACQFASLYVQAEIHPEIKEKLSALYLAHESTFADFFHCLNRFHHFPEAAHLNPENFGQFIRTKIHTYRDLELLVGPAMRFSFEAQISKSKSDDEIALTLVTLKKEHTEIYDLFKFCQALGLGLLNFKNGEINMALADDYSALFGEDTPAAFTIRILHSGGNHFDSVYKYQEMLDLNFNLIVAELEEVVMYVDSSDPAVLNGCKEISGEQIWRRDSNLFLDKLLLPPAPTSLIGYQPNKKKHKHDEVEDGKKCPPSSSVSSEVSDSKTLKSENSQNTGFFSKMTKFFGYK